MKYYILCNEGWPLNSWDKPYTRQALAEKFRDYAVMEWDTVPPKRAFTMQFISEMWNVSFQAEQEEDQGIDKDGVPR